MDRKENDFESWRRVYEGSIHITATAFEEHCKFWKQYLKTFYSYTSLKHTMNAYLLPLLSFSSLMATFEEFDFLSKNLVLRSTLISNLGVSTTILNLFDGCMFLSCHVRVSE